MSGSLAREHYLRTLVGTVLLVLTAAGCGDLEGPQGTSRISGTITIADISDVGVREKEQTSSCYGLGAALGVEEGARVRVEDASRSEVATGKLGQGRLVFRPQDLIDKVQGAKPISCILGFVVEDVPRVGEDWSIRIGKHQFDLPPDEASSLALRLGG